MQLIDIFGTAGVIAGALVGVGTALVGARACFRNLISGMGVAQRGDLESSLRPLLAGQEGIRRELTGLARRMDSVEGQLAPAGGEPLRDCVIRLGATIGLIESHLQLRSRP